MMDDAHEPRDAGPESRDRQNEGLVKSHDLLGRRLSPEELIEILNANPEALQKITETTEYRLEYSATSGPLPGPKIMREYKELDEGLFEQIKAQALAEQENRHYLERTAINGVKRGQYVAGATTILALLLGGTLLYLGLPIGGIATLLFALAALVAPFIQGRLDKN